MKQRAGYRTELSGVRDALPALFTHGNIHAGIQTGNPELWTILHRLNGRCQGAFLPIRLIEE